MNRNSIPEVLSALEQDARNDKNITPFMRDRLRVHLGDLRRLLTNEAYKRSRGM